VLYSEALEVSIDEDDAQGEATALFGLGECARVSGDHLRALEQYSEALRVAETHGNVLLKGKSLRRLGDMQYYLTNLDQILPAGPQAVRRGSGERNGEGFPPSCRAPLFRHRKRTQELG